MKLLRLEKIMTVFNVEGRVAIRVVGHNQVGEFDLGYVFVLFDVQMHELGFVWDNQR